MNSEQKFYEDEDGRKILPFGYKNITPFGVDKPLHKWFKEINEVPSDYLDNLIKSKEYHEKFQNLVYGNWIDAPVEPVKRKSFEEIKKQSAEAIKLFCDTFVLKSKKK